MSVNDELLDALTRHQVYLQRLSGGIVNKIRALLNRSDARIVERLIQVEVSELSRARQERLLREIRRIVESVYEDATGQLQIELEQLAEYEGEFQLRLFERTVPVPLETVRPAPEQIIAAVNSRPFQGRLLREEYQDLPRAAFRRVRDTIRAGFVEGRTTDQIVRDIRGTRAQGFRDGVIEQNRRAAEAVVRTAVNHTANTAREYTYERNSALIKGVRWNATLDGRTTLICASRDGKVYNPGKGPRPPAHYNCRSSTSPVLKSWRQLGFDADELPEGTRAGMDGQVPADTTYDAWLRRQSREFQDEVLGERKAALFREGVKVDRFVDRRGRELTLDELKRREGEAWEKAAASG